MEENMGKKVARICIEGDYRRETTAEAWVFVGTDSTNKIDTTWVYVNEEEGGIPKIIYLIAALTVAGQKMTDAILKTGGLTEDGLQKLVEIAIELIKQKEGEARNAEPDIHYGASDAGPGAENHAGGEKRLHDKRQPVDLDELQQERDGRP